MRNTGLVLSHSCLCQETTQNEARFWSLPPETTLNEPCFKSVNWLNNHYTMQCQENESRFHYLCMAQLDRSYSLKLLAVYFFSIFLICWLQMACLFSNIFMRLHDFLSTHIILIQHTCLIPFTHLFYFNLIIKNLV